MRLCTSVAFVFPSKTPRTVLEKKIEFFWKVSLSLHILFCWLLRKFPLFDLKLSACPLFGGFSDFFCLNQGVVISWVENLLAAVGAFNLKILPRLFSLHSTSGLPFSRMITKEWRTFLSLPSPVTYCRGHTCPEHFSASAFDEMPSF